MSVSCLKWEEAKRGDADEVERIVEKYYRLAFKVAYKWVKADVIEADEAISLSLLALMKCINGNFDPKKGKFSTYLGKAVDNEIRMWLRTENEHRERTLPLEECRFVDTDGNEMSWLDSIESTMPGPDARLDEKETLEEALEIFEQALARMSEKERRCLYLAIVEDLTHAEIGKVVGVSQSYTSRLLQSARKKLEREKARIFRSWGR